MPFDPDVAGELGRYLRRLTKALDDVRGELARCRSQIRLESVEADVFARLTAAEKSALAPFLCDLDSEALQAEFQALSAQRDALAKAISFVKARIDNG